MDKVLSFDLPLRFVAEGDCAFFVFLPDRVNRGTYQTLDAEADNADAHDGFQRQDNLVVLVNENPSVHPEEGEIDDEDQTQGEH